MHFLRYAWYACPSSGSYLYLAIFAHKRCLARWQLTRPMPGTQQKNQSRGIWEEVTEVPAHLDAAETGRCKLPGKTYKGTVSQQLQQALSKGRLLLQLIDPTSGVMKTYSLIQVRPNGATWLFGEVFYLPHATSVPTTSITVETAM